MLTGACKVDARVAFIPVFREEGFEKSLSSSMQMFYFPRIFYLVICVWRRGGGDIPFFASQLLLFRRHGGAHRPGLDLRQQQQLRIVPVSKHAQATDVQSHSG